MSASNPNAPSPVPMPDAERVGAILREVAAEAVLPRFRALATHEVMEKGAGDIVTAADLESERLLAERLTALLPGSVVVGEEAHHADSAIVNRFDGEAPVWVIDPVDGTRNFSRGKETFCLLLALVVRQETRMAWLCDPVPDRVATAVRGAGAFLDGTRLVSPPAPPLSEMVGQMNLAFFPKDRRDAIRARAEATFGRLSSLFCAGHDFLQQAQGLRHFSFYRRLWPWDHAAGVLIREEAGGKVARYDGAPYRAGDRVEGLLSAPDRESWQAIRAFMRESADAD